MSRRKPLFTTGAVGLFLHVSEDTKDDHGDQLKQKQCFGQRHHDHLPPHRGRNNLFSPFADLIIACGQYPVNQPSLWAVFVFLRENFVHIVSSQSKRKGQTNGLPLRRRAPMLQDRGRENSKSVQYALLPPNAQLLPENYRFLAILAMVSAAFS